MRQKRAKAYRKLMHLYSMTFGFRQPYQTLLDAEMCRTGINSKIDIVKNLGITLQGTVKPMITQCCVHELYLEGKRSQAAVDLAKTFERRKCNHREPIPGNECLQSVVGESNKHRYIIATQSQPLRAQLRKIPAVPIVHITRSVMVLEPPSDSTLQSKFRTEQAEEQQLLPSAPELAAIGITQESEPPKKKRKGPKGPNPLSVKKKQKQGPPKSLKPAPKELQPQAKTGEKRKRSEEDEGVNGGGDGSPTSASKRRRQRKKARERHQAQGVITGLESDGDAE